MHSIIVIHRSPFHLCKYNLSIDHNTREVVYLGTMDKLKEIPKDLPCKKYEIPSYSLNEIVTVIESIEITPSYILANSEYDQLLMSELNSYFKCPGKTIEDVLIVRDKLTMRNAMLKTNVKMPVFALLGSDDASIDEIKNLFKNVVPVIVKPRNGASAVGCIKFENIEKVLEKNTLISYENYLVEEYIDGEHYQFDGLVTNGQVKIGKLTRCINTSLDYISGFPIGTVQEDMNSILDVWIQEVVTGLRINEGVFHIEAIINNDDIYFLEGANRPGGGTIPDGFYLMTGLWTHVEHVRSILGLKLNKATYSDKKHGWFIFPCHKSEKLETFITKEIIQENGVEVIAWKFDNSVMPYPRISHRKDSSKFAGMFRADSTEILETVIKKIFNETRFLD